MADHSAGGDARRAGQPRSANPYREGTDAHDRFDLAWLFADTQSAQDLPEDSVGSD